MFRASLAASAKNKGPQCGASKRKAYSIAFKVKLVRNYKKTKWSSIDNYLNSLREEDLEGHEVPPKKTFKSWSSQEKVKEGVEAPVTPEKSDVRKKNQPTEYAEVEQRLAAYLEVMDNVLASAGVGLSLRLIQKKALEIAQVELPPLRARSFKASNGWLQKVFRRLNRKSTVLHGEGDTYTEEERKEMMEAFITELTELVNTYDIDLDHLFNADQTGIFFAKFPNRSYVKEEDGKERRGGKKMTDKSRITCMVATSANGELVPLAHVGKAKNPRCFNLIGGPRPFHYCHQRRAWFDQEVTKWWFVSVFAPWYRQKYGEAHCGVLVDNCPAHNRIKQDLKESHPWIHVLFFPPNLTNRHQPMDQGVIKMLKSYYRCELLDQLVHIYEDSTRLEQAKEAKKLAKLGQVGLDHGERPHVLDAIEILERAWNENIDRESIRRCWRKAECLPPIMQMTLEAEAPSKASDRSRFKVEDQLVNDLCHGMEKLTTAFSIQDQEIPSVFEGSFVEEYCRRGTKGGNTSDTQTAMSNEIREMAETWVVLEEIREVQEQLVEDMVTEIMAETADSPEADECEKNDDPSSDSDVAMDDRQPTMTFHEVDDQLLRIGEYAKSTGCAKLQTAHTQLWRLVQQERTKSRAASNQKQSSLYKFYPPSDTGTASASK
jgi:hypothetical protein